jgi:unsaturated chondroitin disaccharide hydrolase
MHDPVLADALGRLILRVEKALETCGDAYPYAADLETGQWVTTTDGDWCGGLWVAMLWMAHWLTGDLRFQQAAIARTEPLRARVQRRDMFGSLTFYYAAAWPWERTGFIWQRKLALEAAYAMASMYEPRLRQIPVGDEMQVFGAERPQHGQAISAVDNLYVALLLPWWAWQETGDDRFQEICIAHSDRAIELFIRPDGSTVQLIEFDPDSGNPRRRYTAMGYADDSCWSRGQAWCIAGLARAWEVTGKRRYLDALVRTTQYFVANAPEDLVPYYDFMDPAIPDVERDTSAAAIVAASLVRLAAREHQWEPVRWLVQTGCRLVTSLVRSYLTPTGPDDRRPTGMLIRGCFNKPRQIFPDAELLWGDHYLMEALYTLQELRAIP